MNLRLRPRLLIAFIGLAVLPATATVFMQQRSLLRDMEAAAVLRLELAARSAQELIAVHLDAVRERYAAIAENPQLHIALEIDDDPTLVEYARGLRERQGARRILLYDASGELAADASADDEPLRPPPQAHGLILLEGQPHALTSVPLELGDEHVGRLIAIETIRDSDLQRWHELIRARIHFGPTQPNGDDMLYRRLHGLGVPDVGVSLSLVPEREVLSAARRRLLLISAFAVAAALGLGFLVAARVVRPIERVKEAAQRIGEGDFAARVRVDHRDEIGELSEAINDMAVHLEDAHGTVEDNMKEMAALNAELLVSRDRAEASNRAKSEFLANMSHEIRTPMTAMLGYIDLLSGESGSPAERGEWGEIARRNGDFLLGMINSILDLSKVDSGKLEVERREADPREIIDSALSVVRHAAESKGLSLELECGELPETIETDPIRLRQILVNLLGNAVKFTEQGFVRLSVGLRAAPDSPGLLCMDVSDSGIGIDPEKLSSIFEAFSQADSSTTRLYGGTGLGLTISRELARKLGGDVFAHSEPGKGSTFSLRIDPTPSGSASQHGVEAPEERAVRTEDAIPLCGRVLLAEDSLDSQRLLSMLLRRMGLEVEVTADGEDACRRALAAWKDDDAFDLILMDMQMPVLDGYEATRRLREAQYPLPIVALTAHAMRNERARCVGAGCDDYATKPIDRLQLRRVVARNLAKGEVRPPYSVGQ